MMNVLLVSDIIEKGGRRRVVVPVSEEFFAGWLTTSPRGVPSEWTTIRCDDGLPEGAQLVGCAHDAERQLFQFVFEHESFRELLPGEIPPQLRIRFSTRTDPQ